MSISLQNKYRPSSFKEICGQEYVVKILKRQVETHQFVNCYLFSGPSGTGKTTIARILAKEINHGLGEPIEIDAASNNGVDNIRLLIEQSSQRSLNSEYKVYIIDECHMLTNQSWNALLKLIEEPPKYTIFIFCTTELHKVPETIQNRCQQFKVSRVDEKLIYNRLVFISNSENLKYSKDGLVQITKMSMGSMRQAISYLDKCKDYGDITLENVLGILGDFSYDVLFGLVNSLIDRDQQKTISTIEKLYNQGSDLKLLVEFLVEFLLDLNNYLLFKSFSIIKIPESYKDQLEYTLNVEGANKYFIHLMDKMLELKTLIRGDSNIKTTIEIFLISRI